MTRTQRSLVVAIAVAAIVTAANASQGAYFSQSWGWVALAFLAPTTVLLILDRVTSPGRLRAAFVMVTGALAVWIALSSLWSTGLAAPLREGERMLAYVALALAIACVLRRGDGPAVVGGAAGGVFVIASYALATRLFPDVLETYDTPGLPYRLAAPVGYWNGLGLLVAMGFIVTFAVVAHARRASLAFVAAAAMPVLACTLYFTFSRGAWVAQVFGYAAMVAFDPRRLRLLWVSALVAVPSLLVVVFAGKQEALTTEGASTASAATEGHRVAAAAVAMGACSVGLAWVARRVAARMPASRGKRRAVNVALAAAVVLAALAAVASAGGPIHGVETLKKRFEAPSYVQTSLNGRLLSFSGNGRSEQIRVAIDAGRAHPVVGTGAGSYEALWYLNRRSGYVIRDAHSLYAETFGELGLVGLTMLCFLLVVPIAAAVRSRRSQLVPAAAGAYLAWIAHSALDWNWELVGVTMVALLAGGAALVSSERRRRKRFGLHVRLGLVAVTVVLSVASVISLVGNQALFAGREAVSSEQWKDALGDARKARTLLPWSYEAYVVYGDAAAGLGDRRGAVSAYRQALDRAPDNWLVWLRLAQVSRGTVRAHAYARVHRLNPLETDLPVHVNRASG